MAALPHVRLEALLAPSRRRLLHHPIYQDLASRESLARFMESHVFAVWDFMTLLKSLQRRFTCVNVPWTPPANRELARFINEIVVGEESDEVSPGEFMSHLELYLLAMDEVGAHRGPIDSLLTNLAAGIPVDQVLATLPVSNAVKAFVAQTLRTAASDDVDVAAAFLYGREDIIPAMFQRMVTTLQAANVPCPRLTLYLNRHIEVDDGHHGPLARRMIDTLLGDSPTLLSRATHAAEEALEAREVLWDATRQRLRLSASCAVDAP